MRSNIITAITLACLVVTTGVAFGASVSLQLSGKGAVDESTIRAGEPVSVDIYFTNDRRCSGMTLGFKIISEDIPEIVHVADSAGGLNERGDVKGHNDWAGAEVWDLFGIFVVESDWDGKLPEMLGFGAVANEGVYNPHELEKKLSFDILVPTPGTLVIDSAYYPPSGKWMYSVPPQDGNSYFPEWKGPYEFKVIE